MIKRLNILEKQYGGAIPFSALEDKKKQKTNKRSPSKKRNRKRSISPSRMRRKITKKPKRTKKKQTQKKGNKCECGSHKFTGNEETPRGLGHCEECIPLNVVLKGKDGKLYENRKGGWHKLN